MLLVNMFRDATKAELDLLVRLRRSEVWDRLGVQMPLVTSQFGLRVWLRQSQRKVVPRLIFINLHDELVRIRILPEVCPE